MNSVAVNRAELDEILDLLDRLEELAAGYNYLVLDSLSLKSTSGIYLGKLIFSGDRYHYVSYEEEDITPKTNSNDNVIHPSPPKIH